MTSMPELPDAAPEDRAALPRLKLLLLLAMPLLALSGLFYVIPRGDPVASDLPEETRGRDTPDDAPEEPEVDRSPARVASLSGTSLRGRIVTEKPAELRGGRVLLRESPPVEERSYMGLFLTLVEGGAENLEKNLEKVFVSPPVLASTALAADGSFRFSNAPPGSFVIDLEHEWLRLVGHRIVSLARGQHADLGTLSAELAGRLLVKVVGPRGRPVSGASLELAHGVEGMDFDNEEFWSDLAGAVRLFMPWKGRTDAAGGHVFRGLPERRIWELSTTAEGHERSIEEVHVTPGSRTLHVVRLREGAGLRIRVRNAEGLPVSGAKVKVEFDPSSGARGESGQLPFRAKTDGAGLAGFSELPAGEAELRVQHVDYLSHRGKARISTGETKELDVMLERGLEITGRVVDAEGRPVAGAWVSLLRDYAQKVMGFDVVSFIGEDLIGMAVEEEGVRCDADGRFVLGGLARDDRVNLMAGADGFLPAKLGPLEPGSGGHEFRLRKSASVTGRVVDQESGEPVPDFEAMCTRVSWFVFDRPLGRVRGSQDGSFVLSGLPRGRMTLRVRAKGHADSERTISVAEQDFDAGEIRLGSPARVEGMTLGPEGRALAGVRVWVAKGGMGDSSLVRAIAGRVSVTSDAEGRFRLEVPAKRLRLVAEKRGYAPTRSRSVRAQAGRVVKDLEIKLGRGGSLHGVVVDSSGKPLEGWNVEAVSGNSMSIRFARSDESGGFALQGLVSGQYLVDAFPDGVTAPAWMRRTDHGGLAEIIKETTENMIRERVQIQNGKRAEIRLVWQNREASERRALVDLEGTVRVGGEPMDQGIVELVQLGGGAKTRYGEIARGDFEIPAVAPGSYRARIKPGLLDRYLGEPGLVRVPAGPRHRIELGYPGGRLAGRVVYGEDGRPAQGILVSIHARGGYRRSNPLADASFGDEAGATDADGGFAFEGLPAGPYEIYAREMNWAGVENANGAGRLAGLVIREGERIEDLRIELSGGGRLEVIIHDQSGPCPGALVRLLGASGLPIDLFPRTLTDRTGTVMLRNVPQGSYRIGVDAANAAPLISGPVEVVDAKEKKLELYLRSGVHMRLRISAKASGVRPSERLVYSVWERGGALLRAGVLALPAAGRNGKVLETLDLGHLEPGDVVLRIECASFGIIEEERRVPASGKAEWSLELR